MQLFICSLFMLINLPYSKSSSTPPTSQSGLSLISFHAYAPLCAALRSRELDIVYRVSKKTGIRYDTYPWARQKTKTRATNEATELGSALASFVHLFKAYNVHHSHHFLPSFNSHHFTHCALRIWESRVPFLYAFTWLGQCMKFAQKVMWMMNIVGLEKVHKTSQCRAL